jgi:hypothetical protein
MRITPALATMTMNVWHIDYTYDSAAFAHPILKNNGIVNTPHVTVSLWYTPQVILRLKVAQK